ncbi:MAG TPA: hypothetical protein ENK57_21535 [Polyangiaceae bacterium]|nr:hypothetical protein [Polyangiaceae bacterium]
MTGFAPRRLVQGVLLLTIVATGCAPGVRMRGSVSSVSADCADVEAVPLPLARVAIHCPDRHQPLAEVLTDAQGRFELRRDGILSKACWVRVSQAEHDPAIYPLGHLCAVEGKVLEGCHGFAIQAELERRAPPAPEAPDDGEDAPSED